MTFSLLNTAPLFKRLAPAVVAAMVFGFTAEASAMRYESQSAKRYEHQSGGRDHAYRGGDRSYADRGCSHHRGYGRSGHHRYTSPKSSVVIYRSPSYYEPRYGYGYVDHRHGYWNHRYTPRYRSYGRNYGHRYRSGFGYGYGYGRGGLSFGFSGSGGDAVAIVGLTALTLAVLHSANERQRAAHNRAINRAYSAPVGEPIIWNETNGSGRVTVTRTGTLPSTGQPCREFTQEVIIDGQQETAYGTACRQPDGAWQLVP